MLSKAILNRILNEFFFWQNSKIELNQIGYRTPLAGGGSLWKRREPRQVCRGLGAFDALLYGLAVGA